MSWSLSARFLSVGIAMWAKWAITLVQIVLVALPPGWCCFVGSSRCCGQSPDATGVASQPCCPFCKPSPKVEDCCGGETSVQNTSPKRSGGSDCSCRCRHDHRSAPRGERSEVEHPEAGIVAELLSTYLGTSWLPTTGGLCFHSGPDVARHVLLCVWLC